MQFFVSSGDLIADRRFEFAKDLEKRGDLAAAADLYAQAVEVAPGFASAWFALGEVKARLGDNAAAIDAFRRAGAADPEDRHGAAVQLARLTGQAAPMPAGYVRALFDQYAKHYDLSLLEGLDYRGPQLLFDAAMAACAVLGRAPYFDRAFDLGCGTGLASAVFSQRIDSLVGVDLSAAMIEQARRTGRYNHLHVADVLEFLAGEGERSADLAIAADSLPYCSDLGPLARAVARVLDDGGVFVFTVETHDGPGVLLRETMRYAHGEDHVRAALTGAGLAAVSLAAASSRREKSIPVPGLVVVAAKPASTMPRSGITSGG
ncbi:MAG TPA: methyltransferase domain-containing protein [Xanthobacteraceae bacterium]|nr:methyltransferase domain-containing protein [Xanthobacteraceae bacterium]